MARVGDNVAFNCRSFFDVSWFFNSSKELPGNAYRVPKHEGIDNYLAIFQAVPENSGFYKCYGKDVISKNYFTAKGLLEIVRYVECFPIITAFVTSRLYFMCRTSS